ncbi:MAG: hypothetical protein IPP73_06310 [Chitinophagaceae bacterium]|nr:hypothetical protein [Chitinophagaceae bacterium]
MKFYIILILEFLVINKSEGQNVSVNNTGELANPNAILDIKSTIKGILIPRVNLVDTSFPVNGNKPNGLLVWNDNVSFDKGVGFYFWTTYNWQPLTNVYKAGTNITIDSSTNTINSVVILNSVNLDGIVPSQLTLVDMQLTQQISMDILHGEKRI